MSRALPDPAEVLAASSFLAGLPPEALRALAEAGHPVALAPGERLFEQGDEADALYTVARGRLVVEADGRTLGRIGAGEPVGEMQAFAGGRRTATVLAEGEVVLVRIPREALLAAAEATPGLLDRLAQIVRHRLRSSQLARLLPRVLGPEGEALHEEVEAAGEWVHLRSGDRLFREGDASDEVYLVVNGRLAAVREAAGERRVLSEIGSGEPIGEIALFMGEPRTASIYALRESELIRFRREAFEALVEAHPHVMMAVSRVLIERLRGARRGRVRRRVAENIALLPLSPTVPMDALAVRLTGALGGDTLLLDAARVGEALHTPGIAHVRPGAGVQLTLASWLDEQEDRHRFVLYQADPEPTPWTHRCIDRADRVVLVAWADGAPRPGAIEEALARFEPTVPRLHDLVLLHADGSRRPTGTASWLDAREVHRHHHVRLDQDGDVERVARHLAGRSLGLVLSGGGARGFAHIGLVRALREAGIPVDHVGGTSMGAILGGQVALEYPVERILATSRATFIEPRPFARYTLPVLSLLRLGVFDESAAETFGAVWIEDMWLPFFCIASDLSAGDVRLFDRGPAATAALASSAIPGVVAPRIHDGHLLVDGGVMDNLPCGPMRKRASFVLAHDVTDERAMTTDLEDWPSPWAVAKGRLSPFHRAPEVPSLAGILTKVALLSSVSKQREAQALADGYLRPPLADVTMLEMDALERVVEVGYRHAVEALEAADREHAPWLRAVKPV